MNTLIKSALIAGALAFSSFTASGPVAAQAHYGYDTQHYGNDTRNYRDGRDYRYDRRDLGRRYTTQARRDCRPVMRVRYDRNGHRHNVRQVVCRTVNDYGYRHR